MSIYKGFRAGSRDALPVVMGYVPIALAYGILACQAGIPPLMTGLMSVMVFAGSSQFIAVSMMGGGASFGVIILTTFLVNSRHLLMSAALSRYFKGFREKWLPLLAFGLTDETFALSSTAFKEHPRDEGYVLGLQLTSYVSWVGGSFLGAYLGIRFSPSSALGLEFVLYAMFIFLLVKQLTDGKMLAVALFSGVLALLGAKILPGHGFVILATVLGAGLGVVLDHGGTASAPFSGDGPGNLPS